MKKLMSLVVMALLVLSIAPQALYAREGEDDRYEESEHDDDYKTDDEYLEDKYDLESKMMDEEEDILEKGLKLRSINSGKGSINSGHGKGVMMGGQLAGAVHFDRKELRMTRDNILKEQCLAEEGETDRCMEHFGMFRLHLSEVAERIKKAIRNMGEHADETQKEHLRSMMGKVEEIEVLLESDELTREQLIEASRTLGTIAKELYQKYGDMKEKAQKAVMSGMREKYEHMTDRIDRIIRVLKAIQEHDEREELDAFVQTHIDRIEAMQQEIRDLVQEENYEAAREKMKTLHDWMKEISQGVHKYRKNNRDDLKQSALALAAAKE